MCSYFTHWAYWGHILLNIENVPSSLHWGQGPKYPLGTLWKHWEHRQHVTPMCPVIKCWVHFEYTPLCDPDMPSGYILSTFWICPAMWLQCTQWVKNWAHFQCSEKCDHNVPSGQMVNIFKICFPIKVKCNHESSADHIYNILCHVTLMYLNERPGYIQNNVLNTLKRWTIFKM